jgi:hypothetical protein
VDDIAPIAATDPTTPKYGGMMLIAIDGTDIALENSPELVREFGCSGPDKNAATALASVAFSPTVFLLNMASAHASIANDEIAGSDDGKQLKYPMKANLNRSISRLRDCFWDMLTEQDCEKRQEISERLILEIARYPVPIVPNRSPVRKKRFYVTRKAVVS